MTNFFHDESDNQLSTSYAHSHFKEHCREIIVANHYTAICELGGGRRPLFELDEIHELGVDYTILDVSQHELDLAPEGYKKVCADICSSEVAGSYDFVFSRLLAEHVPDGDVMHQNVRKLLRDGGTAFHFFPTLYHPAFVLNWLAPEWITRRAIPVLTPFRHRESKFPAHYSQCYGPTRKMFSHFADLGYIVQKYRPFYGTNYLTRVPVMRLAEDKFSRRAARRRSPLFSSFAWLILRKPDALSGS